MKPASSSNLGPDARDERVRRDAAAAWVVRHDRGLSADEQQAFAAWLEADSRNEAAWRRSAAVWGRFEGAPAVRRGPAAPAKRPAPVVRWFAGALAAAAALTLAIYVALPERTSAPDATVAALAPAAVPETRLLADGTQVRLNAGATVVEAYTARERRVRLVRGEAYFAVTKDPARPFVVEADGVRIEAVGTAFGVALQPGLVDVLVTEGTVRVDAPVDAAATEPAPAPLVTAGHRAVVSRAADAPAAGVVVTEVDMVEVNRANAWRGGLLRLGGATLAELAAEFERQTGRRLVLNDPELRDLRVGGRFPGHDIDGFVRVLEDHYEVRVRREADGTLVLERAR